MAQQTPLYEQHVLCGARMVDFHGWMMPLHYGSQIDEHHAMVQPMLAASGETPSSIS